jgi:hypothetical protein
MNINNGNIGQLTIDSNIDCIPDWPINQNKYNMAPPLIIESRKMVSNLNVEFLQGYTPESFLKLTNNNLGIGVLSPIEKIEINGAIKLGNSISNIDGTIRWTGSDFEGRKLGEWISLTKSSSNINNNEEITSSIIDFGSRKIITDIERHLLQNAICHTVPGTLVKRDSNGNIASGIIKAALLGTVVQPEQPKITSLGDLSSLKVGNISLNDMCISFGDNHKIAIINNKFTFVKTGMIQNENGEMVAQYEEIGINSWENNGNNLLKKNGNIGIGIDKPLDRLHVNGGIILGNTWSSIDGTIRWNGTDFEGRMNNDWVSLTRSAPPDIKGWKDITIAGQAPLIPNTIENLQIIPGDGISIKTNITTNPKSLIISSKIKKLEGTTDDISTSYGKNAGSNTTGSNNVFIGFSSGYSNMTGNDNTFIGKNSGFSNVDKSLNTFIGCQSGYTNLIGQQCTYIGSYAGQYSNAHYNTFIGASAGQHVSIGERNVFIGMKAGRCNSNQKGTGFRNTLIGGYNGFNMTTGCENSAIGYGSHYSLTEGNFNTSIGNNSGYNITTGNYNVFIGSNSGYNFKTGTGNIMIGYKAGYHLDDINNKLIIANGQTKDDVIIEGDLENKILNIIGQLNINGIDIINELKKEINQLKEKIKHLETS